MKDIYLDTKDPLPLDMLEPRGKPVNINVVVESDHAGNIVTRQLQTGIMF